jgi:hypothetical protein
MSMFGNRSASQQVAAGGDGMDPSTARPSFGNRLLGGLDAVTQRWGEMNGDPGALARLQMQQQGLQQRFSRWQLAQYKQANPDPTGTMQNAGAVYPVGSPQWKALIEKTMQAPHYITLGNPETGQQVIDANNPPPQDAGPPPDAVAHLKSDPSLAPQFDEVFGPGAAARAMGGQ